MTAAGKTTAAALAARVAAGESVRVLLVREDAAKLAEWGMTREPGLIPAERKTGVETLTVTEVETRMVGGNGYRGRSVREYRFRTAQGWTLWISPARTLILAPEDAAAVKRAHAEALKIDRERNDRAFLKAAALLAEKDAPAVTARDLDDAERVAHRDAPGRLGKVVAVYGPSDTASQVAVAWGPNADLTPHFAIADATTEDVADLVPVSADLVAEVAPAEAPEVPAATVANREAWLVGAVEALTPLFAEVGETVPAVRVSVGWPGGKGKKNAVIGQCWASWTAADKVSQVFVSPVLDDAGAVLATLAHELVHAVDDCASGHKGRFAKVAKGIGLAGKMTATHAGDELKVKLAAIADHLGPYPHAKLSTASGGEGEKKQTTRMIKCECAACGYTARTTRKWLDEVGAPICPCNREEMTAA